MSDEAPHHDAIDIIAIDRDGGHYVYWVNRLTADDLHSKADIAAVLAWYRHQLAELAALRTSRLSDLRRAWQLGQKYWQQADSQSYAENRRSDETRQKFDELCAKYSAAMRAEG
jgi:hypothetical protein